ncbi:MAG: hypothetical protein KDK24_09945 [Pseudooceanicola sp.]|nr:hypothetical protein [Pseudooceanicola sp.]
MDAPAVADEGPVQPVTGEPEHAPFAASRPGAAPVRRGFGTPAAPDGEDAPEAGAPAEPPPAAADPFDSALIAPKRAPSGKFGARPGDEVSEPTALDRAVQRGAIRVQATPFAMTATQAAKTIEEQETGFGSIPDRLKRADYLAELIASYEEEMPAMEAADAEAAQNLRDEIAFMRQREADLRLGATTPSAKAAQERRGARADEALERGIPAIIELRRLTDKAAAIPMSKSAEAVKARLAAAPDTIADTFKALMARPMQTAAFIGEIAAESGPAIAASIASGIITRNPSLSAAILGGGAFTQEYGASVDEFLQENGVKITNEAEAAAALGNADLMAEADKRGLRRGIVIAAAEMLGQKATGIIEKSMSPVRGAVTSTGVQAATGAGGESAARLAAGQEQSPQDIILEGVAEMVTAPAEIGAAALSEDKRAPLANLTPADRASPLPDETIARGKAKIDEILAKNRGGPAAALDVAPAQPEAPQGVPAGALPLSDLYDDATEAPGSAPARPEAASAEQPLAEPRQESAAAPAAPADQSGRATEGQRPPAANRFEEFPEEDGDGNPTGRTIRVDLETGKASVVEATRAEDAQVQPEQDGSQTGVESELAPAPKGDEREMLSETPAPSAPKSAPSIEVLSNEDLTAIEADPATFQYKSGGDEQGVTDRLRGVTKWDATRAGSAIVFEYADGRRVVADGHQRLGLAKRLRAEGQDVQMPVIVRREADGYSPEDVMVEAALKNIGEVPVKGTPDPQMVVDAAKVLRARPKMSAEEMNLPPASALARHALNVRNLSDDAFGMLVNERASVRNASAVGKAVSDKAAHADILAMMEKLPIKNEFEADQVARAAAADVQTSTQASLFGEEQVAQSNYLERARVLDVTLKRLKKDVATFNTVLERGGKIAAVGNVLDQDANRAKVEDDRAAMTYLARLANTKGPISDALTEAARALKGGTSIGQVVDGFEQAVRRAVQGGGEPGAGVDQGRRADERESGGRQRDDAPQEVAAPPTPTASWVIRDKATGEVVMETFDKKKVEALNKVKADVKFQRDEKLRAGTPQDEWLREIILPLMPALRRELNRLGLKDVGLYLDDNAERAADGVQGMFNRYWNGRMDILIGQSLDPLATLHHEAIHALKNMGLFTDAEWKALEVRAKAAWMKKYDIADRYGDLSQAEQIEEAIAEHFAQWAKGGAKADGALAKAFEKIRAFFEAMGNVLRGAGFQTADDVFARALAGEVGNRPGTDMVAELAAAQMDQSKPIMTKTDAFKRWFGDSKVVDENGDPLVVEHRSDQPDIEEFDGYELPGWFAEKGGPVGENYGNVSYPVYLSIKRPISIPFDANDSVTPEELLESLGLPISAWPGKDRMDRSQFVHNIVNRADFARMASALDFDGVVMNEAGSRTWAVFRPEQIKSVYNRGTFDGGDARIMYQSAYHGSPHDFDRFSTDYMGTGEGAQAFGWGIYLAGRRGVAEYYRNTLSGYLGPDGSPFDDLNPEHIAGAALAESGGDRSAALLLLPPHHPWDRETAESRAAAEAAADLLQNGQDVKPAKRGGRLYTVDIPEDSEMLDWDKPLNQQPPGLKAKLLSVVDAIQPYDAARRKSWKRPGWALNPGDDPNVHYDDAIEVGTIINRIAGESGQSPKSVSLALRAAGIPGHRFLDQGSRGKGEGSHNYVIYDDSRVSVLSKEQRATNKAVSKVAGEPVTHAVVKEMPQAARKESFLRAFASQPIDQLFRIPFHVVGGLDQFGRWKVGKAINDRIRSTVIEKRFGEDGALRFLNPALHRIRAGMVDRYGLPEQYVERDRQRAIQEGLIAAKGKEHVEALLRAGVKGPEARVLQSILTGETVDDADMLKLSEPIRRAIDDLGAEAVELGLISRTTYERNRGTYLHRVYEKHELDDGAVSRWAANLGRSRRKQIIGKQFKGRGLFEQVATAKIFEGNEEYLGARRGAPQMGDKIIILDRVTNDGQGELLEGEAKKRTTRRVYWPADKPIPEALKDYQNRGTFEVRAAGKATTTLWRDFTKEERLRMGEILDARYTIAKTFALMSQDLATGRFFKDIAENEEWSRATPPAGAKVDEEAHFRSGLKRFWVDPELEWVKVPDSKTPKSDTFRYGALAGRYVRADIWRDMEELRILQSPTWLNRLNTQWKLNKTARSPVVHTNNVMSNFMLMDMADVRMPDLIEAIRDMATGGFYFEEAKASGAFGADMVTQEIRENVLKPLLKEMRDQARGGKGGLQAELGQLGRVMDRLYRGLKTLDQKMLNAYQFEDQVFRMATYLRRRQQGATVQEAAIEARDQFINYDIRAPWINAARRTLLPFLAYSYRAIPKVAQTVAERPWKLAKYFAITQALNMAAYALAPSGDDEEEERGSLFDGEDGDTWLQTPRLMRMPYLSNGNPVFLDIRRWVPAGDVFDTQGGDIPAWMQIGGPLIAGLEMYFNKTLFTGDEIVNDLTDDVGERMAKRADFAWKAWMPSAPWIPNSWYQEKIARAIRGEALQWGSNEPYSLGEAITSSIGIKLKPKDVDVGYQIWEIKYKQVARELDAQKSSLKRQKERKLIDTETFQRNMDRLREKRDALDEERALRRGKRS